MREPDERDWREAFTEDDFAALRRLIPQAIQQSQTRSARAHTAYQDPDGDRDVYGAGMSRGAQKELQALVKELMTSSREVPVPGSRRKLLYIDGKLVYLLRVGAKMRKNRRRLRLQSLPESRREIFEKTSNSIYGEPGALFDLTGEEHAAEPASIEETLRHIGDSTLFVAYYSSTPFDVGTIYFAPARLVGRYLEFTDPQILHFISTAEHAEEKPASPRVVEGFADGERPRTTAKLRKPKGNETSPQDSDRG